MMTKYAASFTHSVPDGPARVTTDPLLSVGRLDMEFAFSCKGKKMRILSIRLIHAVAVVYLGLGIVPAIQGQPISEHTQWFERELGSGAGAFGGDSVVSGELSFNQDVFFGAYTTASAGIALNERIDATAYAILWHTDFFSQGTLNPNSGNPFGTGLWTEVGAGLNFKRMCGRLNINPQFGVLNGALLSGGGLPRAFEGVVPNLTVNYDGDLLESELYMGYYVGTRGSANNDFLHWWVSTGIRPWGGLDDWKSTLSAGVHYENLNQTAGAATGDIYNWIGPYVQVNLPINFSIRYSAGWNTQTGPLNGLGDNFYKLNLVYNF